MEGYVERAACEKVKMYKNMESLNKFIHSNFIFRRKLQKDTHKCTHTHIHIFRTGHLNPHGSQSCVLMYHSVKGHQHDSRLQDKRSIPSSLRLIGFQKYLYFPWFIVRGPDHFTYLSR